MTTETPKTFEQPEGPGYKGCAVSLSSWQKTYPVQSTVGDVSVTVFLGVFLGRERRGFGSKTAPNTAP